MRGWNAHIVREQDALILGENTWICVRRNALKTLRIEMKNIVLMSGGPDSLITLKYVVEQFPAETIVPLHVSLENRYQDGERAALNRLEHVEEFGGRFEAGSISHSSSWRMHSSLVATLTCALRQQAFSRRKWAMRISGSRSRRTR